MKPPALLAILLIAGAGNQAHAADQRYDHSFLNGSQSAYRYSNDSDQQALGIFPFFEMKCTIGCIVNNGYRVAGWVRTAGETRQIPAILVLDEDGNPDLSVGAQGWIVKPALLDSINDVAFDASQRRMYFLGTRTISAIRVATVVCVDVDQGTACGNFGLYGAGVVNVQFGNNYNSEGSRVLFDPELGLFIAGRAQTDSGDGDWIGVARLDPVSGDLINAFNTDGRRLYSNQPRAVSNNMAVNAITLSPRPAADGKRHLYIGGDYRIDPNIHDSFQGYVLAIDPTNGNGIGNFGGDNTAWRQVKGADQTYITGMAVQANGKLALLGRVTTGPGLRYAFAARLEANGAPDTGFCSNNNDYTTDILGCWKYGNYAYGYDSTNRGAVVERPDNRDLVYFFPGNGASAWVLQFSASHNTLHGSLGFQFTTAEVPVSGDVSATAMAWDWIGKERMVFAGGRFVNANSTWEFGVGRSLTADGIFADQFGGPDSD